MDWLEELRDEIDEDNRITELLIKREDENNIKTKESK